MLKDDAQEFNLSNQMIILINMAGRREETAFCDVIHQKKQKENENISKN